MSDTTVKSVSSQAPMDIGDVYWTRQEQPPELERLRQVEDERGEAQHHRPRRDQSADAADALVALAAQVRGQAGHEKGARRSLRP